MDDASADPGDPEAHTDAGRGGSSLRFLCAFVLIVVIYPLSVGPAFKMYEKHPVTRPAIEVAYKPLSLLAENNKPYRDFIQWYADRVWKIPVSRPPPSALQTNTAPATGQ